jgi:hypothetical protein
MVGRGGDVVRGRERRVRGRALAVWGARASVLVLPIASRKQGHAAAVVGHAHAHGGHALDHVSVVEAIHRIHGVQRCNQFGS